LDESQLIDFIRTGSYRSKHHTRALLTVTPACRHYCYGP
jgi:L-lysine 2,3-aminomutase